MMTSLLLAACVSTNTLIRMAPMGVEPKIDGTISWEEAHQSSANYGPMSDRTGIMTLRYGVFHFGYTAKGVYFAARTSKPPKPQKFAAGDAISMKLLPPGRKDPLAYEISLADLSGNLPKTARVAGRSLKGVFDYGAEVVETEAFIPFDSMGVNRIEEGRPWGLQMSVRFSSEPEIGYWHLNMSDKDEMGTFIPDSSAPILGLVQLSAFEKYRNTAWHDIMMRFTNPTGADMKIDSKSVLHCGVAFMKLDAEPEKALDVRHEKCEWNGGIAVKAGGSKDAMDRRPFLPGGSVSILDLDFRQGGRQVYRRNFRWDAAKGLMWKDADGLPFLKSAFYPSFGNHFRVAYFVNKANDLVRGGIRVTGDRDGKVYWEKELKGEPYLADGDFETDLPGLPEQGYTVRFAAVAKDGRKYKDECTFAVMKLPWQDSTLGMDRIILPPFKPIEVEKDRISFLQTGYRCGGVLWDEVYAKGENILAAPVTVKLNGAEFKVIGTKIVEQSPDRVIREVKAELSSSTSTSSLHLTATQEYDYDGFCLVHLTFEPKGPVDVESLQMIAPLRNEVVSLYEVVLRDDVRSGPAPDFTLPQGDGVLWSSTNRYTRGWAPGMFPAPVQPYVWLGGPYKGFCWLIDSVKGMSLEQNIGPQRIVRNGGTVTFESDLVNKSVTWDRPVSFKMGFQPTPVKPKDWRRNAITCRMYNYSMPSNSITATMSGNWSVMLDPVFNSWNTYPGDDSSLLTWILKSEREDKDAYFAKLDEYIGKHRDWFAQYGRISPELYRYEQQHHWRNMGKKIREGYLNPYMYSCYWPEFEMYKAEWICTQWPEDNMAHEFYAMPVKSRCDRLLHDAVRNLKDGIDGFYFDCFSIQPGDNYISTRGGAYRRADGSVQRAYGSLLEWRELVKRLAVVCHQHGNVFGLPMAEVHITNGQVVPVLGFATGVDCTERGGNGGDFQDRFPEGYTLADVVCGQAGTFSKFVVSTLMGDEARRERELRSLMGYMCAYGLFTLCDQNIIHRPFFEKAWNIVFDFGWGREGVTPHYYYDETPPPVTHTGKDVRLTVAKRNDAALLMFGNLGDADEVSFDLSGLGFGKATVTDAEDGRRLDGLRFNIDRHGYRLIRVDAERSSKGNAE